VYFENIAKEEYIKVEQKIQIWIHAYLVGVLNEVKLKM